MEKDNKELKFALFFLPFLLGIFAGRLGWIVGVVLFVINVGIVDAVFPDFFKGRGKKIIGWAFTIAVIILLGTLFG